MRQQINLYQDTLIDKPEPFQAVIAAWLVLLAVVAMIGYGIVLDRQGDELLRRQALLSQQHDSLQALVTELEGRALKVLPNPSLEEKIGRLEQQIEAQQQAIGYFEVRQQIPNEAMLHSLEALARHGLPGVWLNKVSVADQGRRISLSGSALEARQVPAYLRLLGDKKVFGERLFARLRVERLSEPQGGADQVEFVLQSSGDAD